jgi:hypothetical protein
VTTIRPHLMTTLSRHLRRAAAAAATLLFGTTVCAQAPTAEVRQIVTFLFQPGRGSEAVTIYEQQLKPIYAGITPLRRFRAYREAESPEPLDLVVISTYDGMAGMDSANAALRRPGPNGKSAFALYGTLSAMTQTHHDQFVEMIPVLSDSASVESPLTVFEYVRLTAGAQAAWETMLWTSVRPFERRLGLYQWSEAGRMLVSDGWDYVRIFGIRSLGDWHRYQQQVRGAAFSQELRGLVAARKTLILRGDARLSVR